MQGERRSHRRVEQQPGVRAVHVPRAATQMKQHLIAALIALLIAAASVVLGFKLATWLMPP